METGIILSVGMIVKNEERYLEKCLEAITPLLKSVKSELVIVDTGSTDKTVEIARRYTDKVHFFEWVNDFSAARNFGLKKCSGEWFMFLDADDIFDADLHDIINFFKNPNERKKYNSAFYITRNYTKTGDSTHSDLFVQRIVRKTPTLRFIGKIHETLNEFFEPMNFLKTFAHHYGYVYENERDRAAKKERNLIPLLETLEENPNDVRTLCQISDVYAPGKEAEKYILKATELSKKELAETGYEAMRGYIAAYHRAYNFYSDSDYEKSVFFADEYISIAKPNEVHLIDAYAYKALALFRLGRYGESLEAVLKYREYYHKMKGSELDKAPMAFCVVNYLDEAKYSYLTGLLAVSHAKIGKSAQAYGYLEEAYKLNNVEYIKKLPGVLFQEIVFSISDIAKEHADFERLAKYYLTINETEDSDKLDFINAALEKLYYDSKDREGFAKGASAACKKGFFAVMDLAAREDRAGLQLLLNVTDNLRGYNEAVYLGIKHGSDFTELIKKLKPEQIEGALSLISRKHGDYSRLLSAYLNLDENAKGDFNNGQLAGLPENFSSSIKELYFAVCALEKAAFASDKLPDGEKRALYSLFAEATAVYVTNIYRPELLNDSDIGVLPPLHRFGYYMAIGKSELAEGNKQGYLTALESAANSYKSMKKVTDILSEI